MSGLNQVKTRENNKLTLLKLGGSLITDKEQPNKARQKLIKGIAEEISQVIKSDVGLRIVLGHGSGSFGHVPAHKYGTRKGVRTRDEWEGFVEVWRAAGELHMLVMGALDKAGIPAVSFPPSGVVTASDGRIACWDLTPLKSALKAGLLPVVYGDVAFDNVRGGTILSTEDLFYHLTLHMHPGRILLAGVEPGVWGDYPANTRVLDVITPEKYAVLDTKILGSNAVDVTGGMSSKVKQNLDLVAKIQDLQVLIFSGLESGSISKALLGEMHGTIIQAED
ncbi:MAG: isopentenyl phosphate kinase [Anaerolineales bacterium]